MWPVIIAEGLVWVRRAISVYTTAKTLLGDDKSSEDEKLRKMSLEDEDIYYYLLSKGLFLFLSNSGGGKTISNEMVFYLVDKALTSPVYLSSDPYCDAKTAAFCTAFGQELLMYEEDFTDDIQIALGTLQNTNEVTLLTDLAINDVKFIDALKKHLVAYKYTEESIEATIKAFSEDGYRTVRYEQYMETLKQSQLFLPDAWVSLIYSILDTGKHAPVVISGRKTRGGLFWNMTSMPLWRPKDSRLIKRRPTSMIHSINRNEVDMIESKMMAKNGFEFNKETKSWVSVEAPGEDTDETEKAINKALTNLGKRALNKGLELLLNKISSGLANKRFLLRTESIKEVEDITD